MKLLNLIQPASIALLLFLVFQMEHWQNSFVTLSGFWSLRVWGVWVNPLKGKIFTKSCLFSGNVESSCKELWKMISYLLISLWCKNQCKTIKNREKWWLFLITFYTLKTWNTMQKIVCILVGTPSSSIISIMSRGWGRGGGGGVFGRRDEWSVYWRGFT